MEAGPFTTEACVVHLADILARALSIGSGGDEKVPPLDHAAWDILRLRADALDDILGAMLDEFEDISSFLR